MKIKLLSVAVNGLLSIFGKSREAAAQLADKLAALQ